MATVTIGATDYDAYSTVADATTYLAARLDATEWTDAISAASDDEKKALVTATRWLDRLRWAGTLAVAGQALAWPRSNVYDREGNLLDDSAYPDAIVAACQELALALLKNPSLVSTFGAGGGKQSIKASEVSVSFFKATPAQTKSELPLQVQQLVEDLLWRATNTPGKPKVYGNANESKFEIDNEDTTFDLTGPL